MWYPLFRPSVSLPLVALYLEPLPHPPLRSTFLSQDQCASQDHLCPEGEKKMSWFQVRD